MTAKYVSCFCCTRLFARDILLVTTSCAIQNCTSPLFFLTSVYDFYFYLFKPPGLAEDGSLKELYFLDSIWSIRADDRPPKMSNFRFRLPLLHLLLPFLLLLSVYAAPNLNPRAGTSAGNHFSSLEPAVIAKVSSDFITFFCFSFKLYTSMFRSSILF